MNYDSAQISSRRNFLKASGITLALPWMESLGGRLHAADPAKEPRRILLVCLPLGIYRDAFVPKQAGAGFEAPEYLRYLEDFRDQYSIISGLDHPGVAGGHAAEPRIFSGTPVDTVTQISLDQRIASELGQFTRFDSLIMGEGDFSFTASGSLIPSKKKMADVFAEMFIETPANQRESVRAQLNNGKSILDFVNAQAKRLKSSLSTTDQNKLEEYFETVRGTENRLSKAESWLETPKPTVKIDPPVDPTSQDAISQTIRNNFDMAYLGFKTDSTRVATVGYFRQGAVDIQGVNSGYHALSHHGKEEGNIAQLKLIESYFFQELARLMKNLKEAREGDATLLDRTTILVTSNLGNGSNHSNKDLPIFLAGGRFEHGKHHAFERSTVPMSNLYVTMLNQMGIATDSFSTSTGPLSGFNLA